MVPDIAWACRLPRQAKIMARAATRMAPAGLVRNGCDHLRPSTNRRESSQALRRRSALELLFIFMELSLLITSQFYSPPYIWSGKPLAVVAHGGSPRVKITVAELPDYTG